MAGDLVFFHEGDKCGDGDASVSAAGEAVAFEEAAVEPFGNGPGRDVADIGDIARR